MKLTERNHPEAGRRWPRSVFGVGTEPDPRFTFANERTFLAWIRTALALLAAGISLDTFVTKFPEALRTAVSILLVLTRRRLRRACLSPLDGERTRPATEQAAAGTDHRAGARLRRGPRRRQLCRRAAGAAMTGSDAGHSDPSEIWDRGVQNASWISPAWTRSILSCFFGCALLLARLAANTSWIIGAVIALAALALALAAVRVSARRYRQAASALSADEPLPDGTLPAIIVALVVLIGVAAVVFVLVELDLAAGAGSPGSVYRQVAACLWSWAYG